MKTYRAHCALFYTENDDSECTECATHYVHLEDDVAKALAAKDAECDRLRNQMRAMAALCDRVAPHAEIARLRRAVEWCLNNHARRAYDDWGQPEIMNATEGDSLAIPAEFADIIKPTATINSESL